MMINITIKCAPKCRWCLFTFTGFLAQFSNFNFLCFSGPLRDRLNKGLNLPRYDRYNFQGM